MPTLNDTWIQNTYNTDVAGRAQDAVAMGQQVGNPWLVNIVQAFQKTFGRMPTVAEVNQVTPSFVTGNVQGTGERAVQNLFNQNQVNATGHTVDTTSIQNAYNTLAAGRTQDAAGIGQQVGNPWLANIANDYMSIFGRLPTAQEVAQVTPSYANPAKGAVGQTAVYNLWKQQQQTAPGQAGGNPPSVPTQPTGTPTSPTVPTSGTPPLPNVPGAPTSQNPPLPNIPGMPSQPPAVPLAGGTQGAPGQIPGLPTSLPGLPAPGQVQTPQLPTILGLTTPNTPVNQPTVGTTDISQFIPTTSQQQQDITGQGITQSQGVAAQDLSQLQSLIDPWVQAQFKQYTDPNSPGFQSMQGDLNNIGMADSGAFPQALASRLAPLISQGALQLGEQALAPSFSTQQDLVKSGTGTQSGLGLADLQRFMQQQDFTQNANLAQSLAAQGQPDNMQNNMGMFASGAQGLGALLTGGSAAASATSYVCKELIKRGLITESDMDDFHVHIMPAMFKKGRAFWKYAMDGWRLVEAANSVRIDWSEYKPMLFDRVMSEPDSLKAVDLYADACCRLAMYSDASLWDERVYRTSFMDSLVFLPRLLTYKPFLEALWKCIRIKTLFIFDNPTGVYHG